MIWTLLLTPALAGPICDALERGDGLDDALAGGFDSEERCLVTSSSRRLTVGLGDRETYSDSDKMLTVLTGGIFAIGKELLDVKTVSVEVHAPPLVYAAMSGQTEAAVALLEAGAPVDLGVDESGATALQIALRRVLQHKDLELTRILLDAGAAPGPEGVLSASLIDALIPTGALELLRERGADMDADVMYAALIDNARHGDSRDVDALLALGASWRNEDIDDYHPYFYLLHHGAYEDAAALGADLQRWGPLALERAIDSGDVAAAKYLASVGVTWRSTEAPEALLLSAAGSRSVEMVDWLLEQGAPIDGLTSDGLHALDVAIVKHDEAAARRLIRAGLSLDVTPTHPITSAHAVVLSHPNSMNLSLLESLGADLNAPDAQGRTPILWAAGDCDTYTADRLLERGAALDATDADGRGVAHYMVECGESDLRWLARQPLDLNARDDEGNTALHLAAAALPVWEEAWGAMDIEFDARRTDGKTPLRIAVDGAAHDDYNANKWARMLIDAGADVNSIDEAGTSILRAAVEARGESVVSLLLGRRAVDPGTLQVRLDEWPGDGEDVLRSILIAGRPVQIEGGLGAAHEMYISLELPEWISKGLVLTPADVRWLIANGQYRAFQSVAQGQPERVDLEIWELLLAGSHRGFVHILEEEGVADALSVEDIEALQVALEGGPRSAQRWLKRAHRARS